MSGREATGRWGRGATGRCAAGWGDRGTRRCMGIPSPCLPDLPLQWLCFHRFCLPVSPSPRLPRSPIPPVSRSPRLPPRLPPRSPRLPRLPVSLPDRATTVESLWLGAGVRTTPASARSSWLLYVTIHGGQRGQHQEQKGIRSCVQREIKKTMDQHGKTSCQSANGHSASEPIARFSAGKPHAEQHHDEERGPSAAPTIPPSDKTCK